ncbi:MAG TPA: AraC family transcriptional regulator, partial [Kofleriaceae bacterium]|nr:AraC family transcriptional regulator [Kofleriaceae bacterium]
MIDLRREDLSDLAKADYVARVNRAIDHIIQNLAEPLGLEEIAGVAHFSSFHFHRVFKSLVGETLATFVKRVRLQRAIQLMSY